MLANGATLEYKKNGQSSYIDLPGLKELPDIGIEPEKVENTCLTDKNKKYENGIGDLGDMKYKFMYENASANSSYRILRKLQESNEVVSFKETVADGTITEFDAQVAVKRTGGGVNGVIEFEATMAVQSDLEYTDPTETPASK